MVCLFTFALIALALRAGYRALQFAASLQTPGVR